MGLSTSRLDTVGLLRNRSASWTGAVECECTEEVETEVLRKSMYSWASSIEHVLGSFSFFGAFTLVGSMTGGVLEQTERIRGLFWALGRARVFEGRAGCLGRFGRSVLWRRWSEIEFNWSIVRPKGYLFWSVRMPKAMVASTHCTH